MTVMKDPWVVLVLSLSLLSAEPIKGFSVFGVGGSDRQHASRGNTRDRTVRIRRHRDEGGWVRPRFTFAAHDNILVHERTTDSDRTGHLVVSSSSQSIARMAMLQDPASTSPLSPFEARCVGLMEEWYRRALAMKCPFMRRRASDLLDAADMIMRFLVIRHKSLDLLGPPPGWRCQGQTCFKVKHLPTSEIVDVIRRDWRQDTNRGYYITGRLNTTIYRDDCYFDGPDPDMPVKGLRKYLNAASQLFDQGKSRSELLCLDVIPAPSSGDVDANNGYGELIVARWRMNGILRLPWKPELPTWTGTTTYHRDADGLIYRHVETWDMTVSQAFLRTFWPSVARRIWRSDGKMRKSDDGDGEGEDGAVEEELCVVAYD